MIGKRRCDNMNVMNKLRNLFCEDFAAEENENGGTSFEVNVKSSTGEVFSE